MTPAAAQRIRMKRASWSAWWAGPAALLLISCASAPPRAPAYDVELRLIGEAGGRPLLRWWDAGTVLVEPEVLFSGEDFESVEPKLGGDDSRTSALWLHLKEGARRRFTEATSRYRGRRLAVIIAGKVASEPRILHPITTGLFEVTGPSEHAIQEMARSAAGEAP